MIVSLKLLLLSVVIYYIVFAVVVGFAEKTDDYDITHRMLPSIVSTLNGGVHGRTPDAPPPDVDLTFLPPRLRGRRHLATHYTPPNPLDCIKVANFLIPNNVLRCGRQVVCREGLKFGLTALMEKFLLLTTGTIINPK